MTYIAVIFVVLFAVYVFRKYWGPLVKAKRYGIEEDAFVSRIEEDVRTSNGAEFIIRSYYVRFLKQNGLENEARLLNPKSSLDTGSRIRIRYLPEADHLAVLAKPARM